MKFWNEQSVQAKGPVLVLDSTRDGFVFISFCFVWVVQQLEQQQMRFAVLSYEQVSRLHDVMNETVLIHGRGNFPTLELRLRDLVTVVRQKLEQVNHSRPPQTTSDHPRPPYTTSDHLSLLPSPFRALHTTEEVTPDHPRPPQTTSDHLKPPQTTPDHPRQPQTTSAFFRALHTTEEVTPDHPRQPQTTLNYPRPPQTTSDHLSLLQSPPYH